MSRTATIHLLTGDYAERLSALYEAAEMAREDYDKQQQSETPGPRRMGETPPHVGLYEEYAALREEALEKANRVDLRALGRREWRALKEKHPPRIEGDDVDEETARGDRLAGLNTDTVEDDLVYAALVAPEFTSRAAYDEWADALSEADFQTVLQRAWSLVNVSRFDPKSVPGSLIRDAGSSSE